MKPAPFDYVRAETLDEALTVLAAEGGDARIIAGGQSLMAMLNTHLAKPKVLIDIMRLPELSRIENNGKTITVGAGTFDNCFEADVQDEATYYAVTFCRGIGPVKWHYRDTTGNNGYDAVLTAKNIN